MTLNKQLWEGVMLLTEALEASAAVIGAGLAAVLVMVIIFWAYDVPRRLKRHFRVRSMFRDGAWKRRGPSLADPTPDHRPTALYNLAAAGGPGADPKPTGTAPAVYFRATPGERFDVNPGGSDDKAAR